MKFDLALQRGSLTEARTIWQTASGTDVSMELRVALIGELVRLCNLGREDQLEECLGRIGMSQSDAARYLSAIRGTILGAALGVRKGEVSQEAAEAAIAQEVGADIAPATLEGVLAEIGLFIGARHLAMIGVTAPEVYRVSMTAAALDLLKEYKELDSSQAIAVVVEDSGIPADHAFATLIDKCLQAADERLGIVEADDLIALAHGCAHNGERLIGLLMLIRSGHIPLLTSKEHPTYVTMSRYCESLVDDMRFSDGSQIP